MIMEKLIYLIITMCFQVTGLSVVVVDRYGRIKIPRRILEKVKSNRFILYLHKDKIILQPLVSRSFEELFDSVEVDIPSNAFRNYNELKKYLLKGG